MKTITIWIPSKEFLGYFFALSTVFLCFEKNLHATELIEAAKRNHEEKVASLINQNVNINERDDMGFTALHYAAKNGPFGSFPILDLLLSKGADPDPVANNKSTPLHYAAMDSRSDFMPLLLGRGANPNQLDSLGRAPLHYAAKTGSVLTANWLLKYKANVNQEDSNGCTPLHASTRAPLAFPPIVKLLLENKADVNQIDKNGRTALHYTAMSGRVDVANQLLIYGANVDIKDLQGNDAIATARQAGHSETAEEIANISRKIAENYIEKLTLSICGFPRGLSINDSKSLKRVVRLWMLYQDNEYRSSEGLDSRFCENGQGLPEVTLAMVKNTQDEATSTNYGQHGSSSYSRLSSSRSSSSQEHENEDLNTSFSSTNSESN